MNLRRMNANEWSESVTRFMLFSFLFIILLMPITYNGQDKQIFLGIKLGNEKLNEIRLEDYSCSYVYNRTMNNKEIYSDYKNKTRFTDKQIELYYIENCINKSESI